jgi:hypothetical protein
MINFIADVLWGKLCSGIGVFLSSRLHYELPQMKKIIYTFLFLLPGIFLSAQPVLDTVTPGLHFVKEMICGYNGYGDSTGLLLQESTEYNAKGQSIKNIERELIPTETVVDPETEHWAYGYYFDSQQYIKKKHPYDTTKNQYNEKGLLIKTTGHDYQNRIIKTVYAYDLNGNCISEIFYRGGIEEYREGWKYDANGNMLSATYKSAGKPTQTREIRKYDPQNRIVEKISYGYWADSTVYTYGAAGKLVTIYFATGSLKKTQYDIHDSLLYTCYFIKNPSPKKPVMDLTDSTYFERDSSGLLLTVYSRVPFVGRTTIVTYKYDAKKRCIEEIANINGNNTRRISYDYNDSLRMRTYMRYGINHDKDDELYGKESLKEKEIYLYDSKGKLIETRRMDGDLDMLERTLYKYVYY